MNQDLQNFQTLFSQELLILQKLQYKLNNQLRAQKAFHHFNEYIKNCKKITKIVQKIQQKENPENFFNQDQDCNLEQIFQQYSLSEIKIAKDLNEFITRRFLLEFSSISFTSISRLSYLLKIYKQTICQHFQLQSTQNTEKNKQKQIINQKISQATIIESDSDQNLKQNQSNQENQQKTQLYVRKISQDSNEKPQIQNNNNIINENQEKQKEIVQKQQIQNAKTIQTKNYNQIIQEIKQNSILSNQKEQQSTQNQPQIQQNTQIQDQQQTQNEISSEQNVQENQNQNNQIKQTDIKIIEQQQKEKQNQEQQEQEQQKQQEQQQKKPKNNIKSKQDRKNFIDDLFGMFSFSKNKKPKTN